MCVRCTRSRPHRARGLCASCYNAFRQCNPNALAGTHGPGHYNYRHGHAPHGARTPEYRAWQQAKERCLNPKQPRWADYGGRGITMCETFLGPSGFERFLAELGPRPGPNYSLDRINVDGNYEPGNVRWADPSQQAKNRRPWILGPRSLSGKFIPRPERHI